MTKTILAAVIFYAAIVYVNCKAFETKQDKLEACVKASEGTDTDCEECYFKVYGHYPEN